MNLLQINQTSNRTHSFLGKYLLLGFHSNIKAISLDRAHIIKRASKKELSEINRKIEYSNHRSYKYVLYYYYKSKTAIFYPEEIFNDFERINVFFRLLKPDSIAVLYCNHYVKDPVTDNYKSIGFISEPRLHFSEDSEFVIEKSEIKNLKIMWSNYSKVNNGSNKAFEIVSRRYNYSFQKFDIEDKLIDLMIAFEALFLTENAELSFKLSLRVAKFLEDVYQNKALFEFMKEAYNLRSKIVHGSVVKLKDFPVDKQRIGLKSKISELQEILRLALRKYVSKYSHLSVN